MYNTRICAKLVQQNKLRSGGLLGNISLTHNDLHDLYKPLNDVTGDIMDDSIDCAAEICSRCTNEREKLETCGNVRKFWIKKWWIYIQGISQ